MRALLAALVLAASYASAAELPGAEATLSLVASAPDGVRPGATGPGALNVTLAASTFVCAQAAQVEVALAVDDSKASEGVVLAVDNATRISIPAGAYPSAKPFRSSVAPNLTLLVARYAAPASTSEFTIRAAVASVTPENACTLDRLATLEGSAPVVVRLAAIPAGDPDYHPEHEEHGGFVFDKVVKPGDSFTWTPEEPGRYPYHDHFRPDRKGLVRVLRIADAGAPTIRITTEGFAPADVAVRVGTPVTWTNVDSVAHTVSADEQHDARPGLEPEDEAELERRNATADKPTPTFALAALAALAGAGAAIRRRLR